MTTEAGTVRYRLVHRPQSLLLRRLLFQVHVWTGIGVGLYIFLIGATGALLVFREELEQRASPALYPRALPEGATAPIADVIGSIQSAYPDHRVASVYAPSRTRPVYFAFVEQQRRFRTVLASASSGAVLGERPETGLIRWITDLHANLLGGTTGRALNGVGALLLLLLCTTGPIIWWPGIAGWRRAATVNVRRSWKRVTWELHGAVGIWSVLVIGMWAVTGAYFAFPEPFQRAIGKVAPLTQASALPSSPPDGERVRADIASIVASARERLPGGQVAAVVLPSAERGPVVVQMSRSQPDHLDNTGYVHFTFDQYTGALLGTWDQRDRTTGDAILSWTAPLHFGNFGGVPLKILWAVLGLSPSLLFATGAVMWWNRVLSRRWPAPAGAAPSRARGRAVRRLPSDATADR